MKTRFFILCGLVAAVGSFGQNAGNPAGPRPPAGPPPGTLAPPPPITGSQGGPVGAGPGGVAGGPVRAPNGAVVAPGTGQPGQGTAGNQAAGSIGGATGGSIGGATGSSIGGATGGGTGSAAPGAVGGTRPAQEAVTESNQEVLSTLPAVVAPPPLTVPGQVSPGVPQPVSPPVQPQQGAIAPGTSPQLNLPRTRLEGGPELHDDRALTVEDHKLLGALREKVLPVFNVSAAESPVRFILRNGVVILTGSLSSEAQKRQVVALVRQTPGVGSVVDELEVGPGTSRSTIVHQSGATSTNLTPTGREP